MALRVSVQKDIGEYTEKLVFGMSTKTLFSIAIGAVLSVAVCLFGMFVLGLTINQLFLPIAVIVGGAFAVGYARPLGLPFITAMKLYLDQWFGNTVLYYKSSVYEANHIEQEKIKKKKGKKADGEEAKRYEKQKKQFEFYERELVKLYAEEDDEEGSET